jgi:antitoxin component of MazEF toxin-antitoxin module
MKDYHVRLRRIGGALGLTVPKPLLAELAWVEGDLIAVTVTQAAAYRRRVTVKGALAAVPAVQTVRRPPATTRRGGTRDRKVWGES